MSEIYRQKDKSQILQAQSNIKSRLQQTQIMSNQNQSLIQTKIQQNSNISDYYSCLEYFINKLFVNNQCCDQENKNYCVICQQQKQIDTKEIESIVLYTLKDLIKNSSEFQQFCCQKLQIESNEINVQSFLEQFQLLDTEKQSFINLKSQNPSQIHPVQSQLENKQIQQDNQKKNKKGEYQSEIIPSSPKEFLKPKPQTEISQKPNQKIPDYIKEIKQVDYSVEYIDEKQDQEFSPDTFITIQVKIRNNGQKKWPEKVYLKEVSHYPTIKHFVPSLASRQTSVENISFISPLNQGQYYYDWVLFYEKDYEETRIGERWEKSFKVRELEKKPKINKCFELISKRLGCKVNVETIKEKVSDLIEKNKGVSISAIINTVIAEEFD